MKRVCKKRHRFLSGTLYVMLMVLFAFSVAQLKVKREDDLAHLFGIGFLTVSHDDMASDQEGYFSSDDLLMIRMLDHEEKSHLNVGDIIITYDLQTRRFIAHRIQQVSLSEDSLYYLTQGDLSEHFDQPIRSTDVIGIKEAHLPKLASTYNYLQSPKGFALLIMLPVILCWIGASILLVRTLLIYHRKNLERSFVLRAEAQVEEVEHEFAVIRKQLLKEFHLDN